MALSVIQKAPLQLRYAACGLRKCYALLPVLGSVTTLHCETNMRARVPMSKEGGRCPDTRPAVRIAHPQSQPRESSRRFVVFRKITVSLRFFGGPFIV